MINRQKTISKMLIELPDNVTLVAEKSDYLDCQKKEICKNITAYETYKVMTSNQPEWLRMLFNLRDVLVKPAGVRAIQGFTNLDEDKYKSGQINTVHFLP
ncbi:hypothetical protein BGI36_04725 [Snodgrassella communis]|uniref:DUF2867 domain-containing protein n=1 Tax=Snodgrassella communis TaxID=2946699 RepID=UPI000C1E98FB|nr:DUF2867 domain-containing protein [Snodgrassella communis]PIT21897.1 hypothetical protein BGI36_04725 [Snodgrassella communis]